MRRVSLPLVAVLVALAAPVAAEMIRVPPFRTVAQLGPCGTGSPKIVAVTDGLTVTDCSVGGGSVDAMCMCRNGEWAPFGNAGSGTVTSVSLALSGLSWMAASGSPVTGSGGFTLSPASGQTPGLVVGTCGSSTTVGLCALTAGMIPPLTPAPHQATHEPGGTDPLAVDAPAGTGSLRTLGTGAQQAAAGNDARLSDARTPTAHTHAAADITSGIFDPARLASGTPSGTTFVAGDGIWKTITTGPGGSDTQLQFNDAGALAGASGLTWTKSTTTLAVPTINAGNLKLTGNTFSSTNTNGDMLLRPNGSGNVLSNRPIVASVGGQTFISGSSVTQYNLGMSDGSGGQVRMQQGGHLGWSNTPNGNDSLAAIISYTGVFVSFDSSTVGNGLGAEQAGARRLVPRSTPPFTCDSSKEGSQYYDAEDHDLCTCKGASPAWASSGAGACS